MGATMEFDMNLCKRSIGRCVRAESSALTDTLFCGPFLRGLVQSWTRSTRRHSERLNGRQNEES